MTLLRKPAMLGILLLILASGCVTTNTTGIKDNCIPCSELKPITYSYSNDTKETIKQIRPYNAIYDAICIEDKK